MEYGQRLNIYVAYTATHCNTLQHTAIHYNTLQHAAARCNTLQQRSPLVECIMVECDMEYGQHLNVYVAFTATHCNTLQHTATHCNTLRYDIEYGQRLNICGAYKRMHNDGMRYGSRTTTQYLRCIQTDNASTFVLNTNANTSNQNTFVVLENVCRELVHTTTHCDVWNTLQHTATHCNTLQHTETEITSTWNMSTRVVGIRMHVHIGGICCNLKNTNV